MNETADKSKDADTRRAARIPDSAERAAREKIPEKIGEAKNAGNYGMWTLVTKEFKRFWSVATETIISPVITTLLYFLVFGLSFGRGAETAHDLPYVDFLVPGLMMFSIINNAYLNSAFSFFIGKIHGNLVDILVTPLSPMQLLIGYTAASLIRATIIGLLIWVISLLMGADAMLAILGSSAGWFHVVVTICFMLLTALAFALLGLSVAIIAEDFDHITLLPNFLITPLTFLGGVFYSIEILPAPWQTVSKFNPVLYVVNGLRWGMTGYSDVPVWQGGVVVVGLVAVFGATAYWLLVTGKKIRE